MGKHVLLDLFCGAGGAAMGYHKCVEDATTVSFLTGEDGADDPQLAIVQAAEKAVGA